METLLKTKDTAIGKEKFCYRFNSELPDERGAGYGYQRMYKQVYKALNSKSYTGFKNYYRRIVTTEALYVSCTDGLIGMLDGSIGLDDEPLDDNARLISTDYEGTSSDHAVYLDKSARPISTLVEGLWSSLAKPGISLPDKSYVNIDKEIWLGHMHVPASRVQNPFEEDLNFEEIDQELLKDRIEQLRSIYLDDDQIDNIDEDNLSKCWQLPTLLDGKNVAIIDEVQSSGFTLRIALELFKRAFPKTKFSCMYWSSPRKIYWEVTESEKSTSKEFAASWAPFWYDPDSDFGRGIGDIDEVYSLKNADIRQRIGRYILSAPHHRIVENGYETFLDTRSEQTYHDLNLLIDRFRDGEVIYRPNPQRIDFKERACRFNNMNFDEYVDIVKSL